MATIKINNDLHYIVKRYCVFTSQKLNEYIEGLIAKDEQLKEFDKNIKRYKFNYQK